MAPASVSVSYKGNSLGTHVMTLFWEILTNIAWEKLVKTKLRMKNSAATKRQDATYRVRDLMLLKL